MTSSLIRGKYVIAKITGPSSADVVTDGAVLQQDGLIAEVGDYQELRTRHPEVEVCWQPAKVGHFRKGEIRGKWPCSGTPGAVRCSVCVGLRSELSPPFS